MESNIQVFLDATLNILIAISVGIPTGIITGIWVKKNAKLKQEILFEKNREVIIMRLLSEIYYPFYQIRSIFEIFARKDGFSPNKDSSYEFSDLEYGAFMNYYNYIQNSLKKLPKFHDCATFIQYDEYLAIKKYIMSAVFFYRIDASRIGKKNMLGYNNKIMTDHALFAKQIIEFFQDKGLHNEFNNQWAVVLQEEGMLDPNFKRKSLEPGDIVPTYYFDSELL